MAVEKGKVEEDGNEKGVDISALSKTIQQLQQQVEQLQKEKQPGVASHEGPLTESLAKSLTALLASKNKEVDSSEMDHTKQYFLNPEIEKEDFDERGSTFCAFSTMFLIVDDMRNGKPVLPPLRNRILFDFQAVKRYRVGKYDEIATYCSYTSHSKKEIEWLKEHKLFGIRFFESAKDALSSDNFKAQVVIRCMNTVNSMAQDKLVKACNDNGVSINSDIRTMRVNLANKLAEIEERQERNKTRLRVRESNEEAILNAK